MIIKSNQILFVLVIQALFSLCYTQSYLGCYTTDSTSFYANPSVLDASVVSPYNCILTCETLNYQLAGLRENFCFCSNASLDTALVVENTSCSSYDQLCIGDSSSYCGSSMFMPVYSVPNQAKKILNFVLNDYQPWGIHVFNRIPFSVNISTTLTSYENVYIYWTFNEKETSSGVANASGTFSAFFYGSEVGINRVQVMASLENNSNSDSDAKLISFTAPIVVDQVQNAKLNCTTITLLGDWVECEVKTAYGSSMVLTINFGDGTSTSFTPQDTQIDSFGIPVPKSIIQNSFSPVMPGFYYLINTVAYYDGIIRSVEIYGDYSGMVYFYLISPNSCSYVRKQNPFECGTYSNQYTFNCSTSDEYVKSQSACRNAHLPNTVLPSNFSATFISSEWINTGFYHVASLENIPIKAGSFIGWYKNSSTSGSIMLDPNCVYSGLPSLRVNGSNFDVLDSSLGFCQFYMNVFVARPNKMSTLKTYSLPGEYTVSATLHNVYGTSTLSQNIIVVGNLTNLTILANNGQPCIQNIACNLTAITIGGLNVSFNWSSTEFQPISTQNASIYPIFTSAGTFWVNLTAYDEYSNELAASVQIVVSIQNYSLSLQVLNTDSISSLYPDVSLRNLSLLFSTGPSSQYVCVLHIDSSMTFNETMYPNNSVIVYQANRTGDYHITLNCSYPYGSTWFNFTHRVEDPIKNLTLLNNTVSESTPFQLMASIQSGTNPVVSLWLNGVKDNGFTFNDAQLTGISSPFATALPGLNNVTINAYNNVSNVTIHSTVLVVYPIQNTTITCLSPTAVINGITYYAFGTTINCTLNMLTGSDVSAIIYAGDSSLAIYSNNFTGQWSSPISFTHNYLTPGDYQATVLLSNALSQVTLTKTIGMVSSVNQLIPSSSQSSVNLGNPVQFWFSYSGTTMSGSNSEVTFWPGDASNATQGPFNLSMNFNTNLSGANLAYTYTAPGIFNVTFLVRNVLGQQAVYSLSVEVIASLSGLYVQLSPPSILLGQTVTVNVYLTQGTNALLNCLVNGVFLTSITRTSTSYLIPDTITYTPSIEGNFTITVVANNSYASISENAVLSVESAVNVNVVTNPANVSIINNLGASSRTITFTINSLNSLASTLNSQYLVDFNDTTPVSLPQYFASTSASLSHTFNTSGTYYVNVTVFNQVSNTTIMLKIQILADFSQLYCQPGWCMYPNSGLPDTLYTSSNSVYNIKKEKDLRLRCSWTSDIKSPVDMITANFASQQYVFTNITNLDTVNENRTYFDSQQAFGYIITISSDLLALGQSGLMSVTISNSLYSRTYALNISIQSSIVLISPTNNQLPIRPRSVYTYKIDFQSLGEPSCASISIQNEAPFAIGTSSSDCSTLFSSLSYSGSYRTNGTNTWSFSYQMNTLGLILMKATMKNSISSQTVSQYVTVSNLDCANPSIQLDYYSPIFYQPIVYKASDIVDIIASVSVKCNVTQSYSKQWSLYKVNSVTGGDYQSVDLSSNPTWQNNEIVIQKNSISFGLYRLNFKAIMTASSVSGIDAFQASVDTFIQIDPSGYVVDSFDGQISQITLGTNQLLSFNPMLFSIDLGTNSLLPSDTKFYFYCTVVDNGIAQDYPQSYQGVYTDLALFKSNQIQMNSNRNCFNDSNGFSFDSTLNMLTINSAYLVNQNNRLYRFKTQLASLYYQELDVMIKSNSLSPIFKISCNPTGSCVQQSSGSSYRVNPNNQLIINAFCISNCSLYSSTPVYSYNIYRQFKFSSSDTQEKWLPCAFLSTNDPTQCTVLSSTILGQDSTNLTLFSSFFSQNPLAVAWKIEFTSNGQTNSGSSVLSSSSIILSVNQLPTNGSCSVSRNQGYSMDTIFLINCTGWIDPDGQVERYEFYASFKNDPVYVGLGYNSQGWLSTQIPNGPSYDSYNVYLIVKVIDDFGGITAYTSANLNIQVLLNTSLSSQLMGQMLSSSTVSSLMQDMFSGDPQKIIQNVNGLSSMLNSMGSSGQGSDFGPSSIASNASFNDLANLRSQAQSNATTIDESSRNVRANVRSTMMAFVSNMSLSDMTSIKMQSSILSMLTQQTSEVDRTSSNNVINKCSDMVNLLQSMSSQETLSTIQDTATNIIAAMSNVASGLSDTVNNKTTTLSSDYLALKDPSTFDSDPEIPENNPYTLNSDTAIVSSDPFQRQNLMKQKLAAVNAYKQTEEILNSVSTALGSRLAVGQTAEIKTPNLVMSISRVKSSASPSTVSQGLGKIVLPSYCSLNPTSTCASETVLLVSKAAASAAAGLNGNNETSVQNSGEISLSFYDSDNNPIGITNSSSPIDLYIPRSITMTTPSFQFVNATNIELHQDSWFIPNGIIISSANASVFIQLKFENSSAGYVLLTKFGATPRFNNSFKDFDDSAIFCPSVNVKTDQADRFFQYLSNINKTAGFVGLFGFSIREMNDNELNYYCVDGNSTLNYSLASSNNFYSNFWLRTFTTGCYSYNFNTNSWTSYGMEVMADTNMLYTHCTSSHLTNFAGGLQVLPPSIDFAYVFANASFTKNLTIYLTVIIVTIFFILFCIMTYWMDRRDDVKVGFTLAPDNRFSDTYFYEIGVYTGSRKGAATDSIVKMLMAGAYGDTGIRRLIDKNRKPFRRGGIDTFIISTYRPLGELDYIRIWHDNSGQGGNASWYLKFIIVKDLQTNERSYFVCNKWLALEKDDGKIERLLLVASETQLKQFRYLLEKEAKQKFADGHLWFSVFSRPINSSFTRLERATCVFVLLYLTMLMNILYYGVSDSTSAGGLEIGPILVTTEQVVVGIVSNLIIFPPSLILVEMFRRARRRKSLLDTRRAVIDEAINNSSFATLESAKRPKSKSILDSETGNTVKEEEVHNKKQKKKSKPLRFPWWFKIIAYILSAAIIVVCILFIIFKGISLGDATVQKWLASFFISALTSIFLTQPLKIILLTVFCVAVFKKDNREDELEEEDQEVPRLKRRYRNYVKGYKNKTEVELDLPKQVELERAKRERIKELECIKILREILYYSVFLVALYMITFNNFGTNSFKYRDILAKQLFSNTHSNVTYDKINSVDEMYYWFKNTLLRMLRVGVYYNNQVPSYLSGFMNDFSSRLIGYAIIRQIRVENNSCTVPNTFKQEIPFCVGDYSVFSEEKSYFDPGWKTYNSSDVPSSSMERIYSSFKYRSAFDLNGFLYSGKYASYMGGGYVYEMRGSYNEIVGNISLLQELGWIDRQTRAIFVEFTSYNPNIDLFSYCTILFELLPTGNIVKSYEFLPMNLFADVRQDVVVFKFIFFAAYLAFILFFMVREIRLIIKLKKKYVREFWSWVEWIIVGFSWAAFAMVIYRIHSAWDVMSFFEKSGGYGYIKLQYAAYWNQMLGMCLAFCCFFGTLKFFKLLRFYPRINVLMETLSLSSSELVGFGFIFIIVWFSFVQTFFLLLFDRLSIFNTILETMVSCFSITLGVFPPRIPPTLLSTFFYIFYCVFIIFVFLNIFVVIIVESFCMTIKQPKDGDAGPSAMILYFKKFLMGFFGKRVERKVSYVDDLEHRNDGNLSGFDTKTQALIDKLAKVFAQESTVSTEDLEFLTKIKQL